MIKLNGSVYLLLMILLFSSCERKELSVLDTVLKSKNEKISSILTRLDLHELQISLSTISRNGSKLDFIEENFQKQSQNYFYPASTVKFPLALAALEKAKSLENFNSRTPFKIEGDTTVTTIQEDVKKIFALSDNPAYNRLYEFVGGTKVNKLFYNKGIPNIQIRHRLSTSNAAAPYTKAIYSSQENEETLLLAADSSAQPKALQLENTIKGRGYYKGDSLIHEPFDFSKKNYLPIESLQEIMKRVIFPESFLASERFDLDTEDYTFLLKCMSLYPREQGFIKDEYFDSYCKFLLFGDTKAKLDTSIRIFNKIGMAYGTLTDCAYVKDANNDIEYILTATLLVNEDQVFNDDQYEYETLGIPFLAELGQLVHKELIRRQNR